MSCESGISLLVGPQWYVAFGLTAFHAPAGARSSHQTVPAPLYVQDTCARSVAELDVKFLGFSVSTPQPAVSGTSTSATGSSFFMRFISPPLRGRQNMPEVLRPRASRQER